MKDEDLEIEVQKAYKSRGIEPMTEQQMEEDINKAHERVKSGEAVFYSDREATEILSARKRKRPLPVALSAEQHAYLDSKGGKAEYMRNLLIIDMEKNK